MIDDQDDKPFPFRVVSDNPNARADRQISWAKEEAKRSFAVFAASLLRIMAGSDSEVSYLGHRFSDLLRALEELKGLNGGGIAPLEIESMLKLRQTGLGSDWSDSEYRSWLIDHGMDLIVQGALRLAAHKILDERPHFGGKYSEDVIERGIRLLEEARQPPPKPKLQLRPHPTPKRRDVVHFEKARVEQARVSSPSAPPAVKTRTGQRFSPQDLKELRKAIKEKDSTKIAQLTAKLGKPPMDE